MSDSREVEDEMCTESGVVGELACLSEAFRPFRARGEGARTYRRVQSWANELK
jgi:hypothetical protein